MKQPRIPQISLFVVLLVLLGVVLGQFIGSAQALGNGPYALMQHSNVTANAGVFRLDTRSGGVSYCYVTPNIQITCTQEAH
ncbi:MAG: hypothetical protein AB7S81_01060 [Bdellovibrionales bacterium]